MGTFPTRDLERLAASINALETWTIAADEQNVRVTGVTVQYLSEPELDADGNPVGTVQFERDPETGEYGYRVL
jgi:type IV secretory pathway protease TraF